MIIMTMGMAPLICLNPYYTGIHLHNFKPQSVYTSCVLILIILEYIYIDIKYSCISGFYGVLILIILEYIYIHFTIQTRIPMCLNPYYTGIHLHVLNLEGGETLRLS